MSYEIVLIIMTNLSTGKVRLILEPIKSTYMIVRSELHDYDRVLKLNHVANTCFKLSTAYIGFDLIAYLYQSLMVPDYPNYSYCQSCELIHYLDHLPHFLTHFSIIGTFWRRQIIIHYFF